MSDTQSIHMIDNDQSRPTLEGVQALRAFGMLSVLIGHALLAFLTTGPTPDGLLKGMVNFEAAGEGVLDLFFVGSGFIMIYISAGTFGEKGAWKKFLHRRLTRVVPIFWVYLTLAIVVGAVFMAPPGFQEPSWARAIKSYLFIPYNVVEPTPRNQPWPILLPGWTLNFEMLFYATFASFMWLRLRTAMIAYGVFLAGLLFLHNFTQMTDPVAFYWTTPQFMKFYGGCLLGYAYIRGVRLNIPDNVVIGVMLAAGVLHGVWYCTFSDYMYRGWFHAGAVVTAGILIAGVSLTPLADRKVWPIWLKIGDASYSIYLLQNFVLLFVLVLPCLFFGWTSMWTRLGLALLGMLIAVVLGFASYRYLERPMTGALRQLFKGRSKTL